MKTTPNNDVSYLLTLFQSLVLFVSWPSGKKGCKGVDFTKITTRDMLDPAYREKLSKGNIGVVQGDASGGIGSLDIDDDAGAEEFLALPLTARCSRAAAAGCIRWLTRMTARDTRPR
jgi:hypothetical protein